jgi:hypothetical protein
MFQGHRSVPSPRSKTRTLSPRSLPSRAGEQGSMGRLGGTADSLLKQTFRLSPRSGGWPGSLARDGKSGQADAGRNRVTQSNPRRPQRRALSVKKWPRQGRGHDRSIFVGEKQRQHADGDIGICRVRRSVCQCAIIIDPMQAGSAMPLFRQTSRRTLHGELVVKLLPQDFCHCQR